MELLSGLHGDLHNVFPRHADPGCDSYEIEFFPDSRTFFVQYVYPMLHKPAALITIG